MEPTDNLERITSTEFQERAKSGASTEDTLVEKHLTADSVEKQVDPDNPRVKRFVISTGTPDRDNDTIKPTGWKLENFKKNPVVLFSHSPRDPIGRANAIFTEGNNLKADIEFMPKEMSGLADSIHQMVEHDFLKATSVGFLPLKFEINDERGGLDFNEVELMETSVVSVPAQPEALVEAKSKGLEIEPYTQWLEQALDDWLDYKDMFLMARKDVEKLYKASKGEDPSKGTPRRQLKVEVPLKEETSGKGEYPKEETTQAQESVDQSESSPSRDKTTISFNRAHPNGTPKAPKDREWDGPGEVSKADVDDLMVMSAWVAELDEGEEEHDKGDFKGPHHVAEGRHAVVWRGVVAAMSALLGARGGFDVPEEDRRGIYNHLAKHYREFDEEPPPFEAAQEQILAKDNWAMDWETGQPVTVQGGEVKYYEPSEYDEYSVLKKEVQSLHEKIDALEAMIREQQDHAKVSETPTSQSNQEDSTQSTEDEIELSDEDVQSVLKEVLQEANIQSQIDSNIQSAIS